MKHKDKVKKANPIVLYIMHHLQACTSSVNDLLNAPFASLMTVLVIAIALALPAGLFVVLKNVQQLSHGWDKSTRITAYLSLHASPERVQQLMQRLHADPDVVNVRYISPDAGLAELQKATGFSETLKTLKTNPLPGVLFVQPILSLQSPDAIAPLLERVKHLPDVDIAQLDMAWVKRLYYLVDLGRRAVSALALFLGLGVLLIIGNTIRLATQSRRREITTLKWVGATEAYVRRPFLYTGIWYGLFGSAIAWMLVLVVLLWLQDPIAQLTQAYGSQFRLNPLDIQSGTDLLVVGSLLGWLGAWLAVRRHLNH